MGIQQMLGIKTPPAGEVYLPATINGHDQNVSGAQSALHAGADGSYYATGSVTSEGGFWLVSGDITDFDIRFDLVSGSPSGNATDTWLAVGIGLSWAADAASGFSSTVTGTLRIRATGGGADLASSDVTLYADAF